MARITLTEFDDCYATQHAASDLATLEIIREIEEFAIMALATPLNAPPAALPWYRVIPPFGWFTQPKQPKRLRPARHSAWVEALHQPVLFAI